MGSVRLSWYRGERTRVTVPVLRYPCYGTLVMVQWEAYSCYSTMTPVPTPLQVPWYCNSHKKPPFFSAWGGMRDRPVFIGFRAGNAGNAGNAGYGPKKKPKTFPLYFYPLAYFYRGASYIDLYILPPPEKLTYITYATFRTAKSQ